MFVHLVNRFGFAETIVYLLLEQGILELLCV